MHPTHRVEADSRRRPAWHHRVGRPAEPHRQRIACPHLDAEHLRRHDWRHTGFTWFADAGVPLHRLQQIAGHTDPRITQRYLHPDIAALQKMATCCRGS
ncbi:tyrosine-type recombinase/integrase [Nocardia brasiliensis]|uniref:tyrosine-type recombinase/integrase n=1 Tax=Nocardia brasiliensis TaxID=37326 RepID=UPI00379D5595